MSHVNLGHGPSSENLELHNFDPDNDNDTRGLLGNISRPQRARKSVDSAAIRPMTTNATRHSTIKSPPARHHRFSSRGQVLWPLQTAAWIASLLLFGAIIALLSVTHSKPQPEWSFRGHSITIGALLSVLGTLSTIFIMVPITASLGQLKWIRFKQQPRPLSEHELIDQASRGPWGSLKLLWKRRGGYLIALGAFVTILVVFHDPFLQQVVHYEPHQVPAEAGALAGVPITTQCDPAVHTQDIPGQGNVTVTNNAFDTGTLQGLYFAAFEPAGQNYAVTPICTTSNCTWDPYWTLGLCTSCGNITDNLKYLPDKKGNFLTNGFGLLELDPDQGTIINISNYALDITHGVAGPEFPTPLDSILYKGAHFRAADIFVIYDDEQQLENPPQAWECMLQFCARQYQATVQDGVFTEVELGQWKNTTSAATAIYEGGFIVWDEDLYFQPDETTTLRINQVTAANINLVFDHVFQPGILDSSSSDLSQQVMNALESSGIDGFMTGIADSIGRNLRTNNVICNVVDQANGTADSETIYVRIDWGWIAMPAAIQVFAFIFYAAALVVSRRSKLQVWKESGLPWYFHGLANTHTEDHLNGIEDMEEVAKELKVGLMYESKEGPWKLMKAVSRHGLEVN